MEAKFWKTGGLYGSAEPLRKCVWMSLDDSPFNTFHFLNHEWGKFYGTVTGKGLGFLQHPFIPFISDVGFIDYNVVAMYVFIGRCTYFPTSESAKSGHQNRYLKLGFRNLVKKDFCVFAYNVFCSQKLCFLSSSGGKRFVVPFSRCVSIIIYLAAPGESMWKPFGTPIPGGFCIWQIFWGDI